MAAALLAAACGHMGKPVNTAQFLSEEAGYREARAKRLLSPNGWLAVAGLTWLHDGPMTIGADPKSDVVLPEGAPARAGVLDMQSGAVTFTPAKDADVKINDQPAQKAVLRPDADPNPDRLDAGSIAITLIKRNDRIGVRMRDPNAATRKNFKGLNWFPPDASLNITGKWVKYPANHTIRITNILGMTSDEPAPGYAEFEIQGKTLRLTPYAEDGGLSFMFRDGTSGKSSYPTGRFLDVDMPKGDTIALNFNRAYNPPCAYIAYATCPIAPPENILTTPIEAGEKKYEEH